MNQGSFKDLEEVSLKATYNIEIGDQIIEAGETIAYFDKIQLSTLSESNDYKTAHGGYGDATRVIWETTKEINFMFTQGIFSKEQFALMTNSKIIEGSNVSPIFIRQREYLESNENGQLICKFTPVQNIFIYNRTDGTKLPFTQNNNILTIENNYMNVIVDYEYEYNNIASIVQIGAKLFGGFVSLEGKTRVKDDITGNIVTGIIKIPKLRILSNLSMRLGSQASPIVGTFKAVGYPIGQHGSNYVMEFSYLYDDITSDF